MNCEETIEGGRDDLNGRSGIQRGAISVLMNKLHAGNEAEVAVLVSDQYQKLGLGNELLRRVVETARDEKLSRVSAEMLTDNVAMQVIMKRLGFRVRTSDDLTSVRAFLDL
jgi:acetyltransferase